MCKHILKETVGGTVAPSIALCRLGPGRKNGRHPGGGSSVAERVQGEPQSKDIKAERERSVSSNMSLQIWEPWLLFPKVSQKCGQKVGYVIIIFQDSVMLSMAWCTHPTFSTPDEAAFAWIRQYTG